MGGEGRPLTLLFELGVGVEDMIVREKEQEIQRMCVILDRLTWECWSG